MKIDDVKLFIRIITIFLLLFVTSVWAGESARPDKWATPVQLQGVGNFFKITDHLYRSEQPSEEGLKNLKKMGIKAIINLRAFHSDSDELKGTGLFNEELSIKTWHIEDDDVIKVLKIIRKKENGPFLVHCQHGADRTGVMCAMFRIIEQGWTKDEAILEMVEGGYGFHPVWRNVIEYVKDSEIEKIKKEIEK